MSDQIDVPRPDEASPVDPLEMRGEDGEIRRDFVERVERAIRAGNSGVLRSIVAELHEADLGDLIAALGPEDRVSLVELTGTDFDFSALKTTNITERTNVQFRAEFFNLFNRKQFAPPDSSLNDASFGQVQNDANQPRLVQLSLRVNF